MKTFAPLLLLAALLAPAALPAASPFEGKIAAKITNDGQSINIDYAMKPGFLRTDIRPGSITSPRSPISRNRKPPCSCPSSTCIW